ncbi:hypothetical protein BB561_001828 [Smittium simulii]|uniref:deoxyhypusine synthase n=1 Tax=Smittium simulii TaxID=133385 RepID=A0A2T9YSU1_9FUNG|nr:hypothetical protein BB561_001828 [Smittium simulii]
MASLYKSFTKTPVKKSDTPRPTIRNRVLLISSRGITTRQRHLFKDFESLLPHSKKDSKLDTKKNLEVLNELAELSNCDNVLYFEARRHEDLYLWASKAPSGPSIKFQVLNLHTMSELKLTGNCLKGSRPLLSFDSGFEDEGPYQLTKALFEQIFSVPVGTRKSKPFFDHIMSFSIIDDKIWVRNYQIVEKNAETGADISSDQEISLVEIGPRYVLDIIRIFEGSFYGRTLYENKNYYTPSSIRAAINREKSAKYASRAMSNQEYKAKIETHKLPEDTLSALSTTAQNAVFVKSSETLENSLEIKGYDFSDGLDYEKLLSSYLTTGFQASNFAKAVDVVNNMLSWKLSEDPDFIEQNQDKMDLSDPAKHKCKIFLGYTSNMISSGLRENFLFLAKNKMIDVIVTTAGGIEEDFIKCLAKTYLGDFNLSGETLRKSGLNRIGNLLVPNNNYCKFEDWIMPILDQMLYEQQNQAVQWTPSKIIHRLGKEIDNPESVYYWAYKAVFAGKTGMIILGGGAMKHHICNANLMRNGAEYSVFINTGQEFDGSDAGARPDEAVSWGKIKPNAESVKIYSDASLIFPLLVAQTFAKKHFK